MRNLKVFLSAWLIIPLFLGMGAYGATASPASVVQQASNEIVTALKKHEGELKKDPQLVRQMIHKYLLPHFDFGFTSQLVLGRYWRIASPEQRKEFEAAFVGYLVNVYANALKNYHGGHVVVLPFRGNEKSEYVKVRTRIEMPGETPISVDYALRKVEGEWKVFDVIIAGVSYVQTYANEFRPEIEKTSLQAVIKRLQHAKPPSSLTSSQAAHGNS